MATVVFQSINESGEVLGEIINGIQTTRVAKTAIFLVDGVQVQREIPLSVGVSQIDSYVESLRAGLTIEEVNPAATVTLAEAKEIGYTEIIRLKAIRFTGNFPWPYDPTIELTFSGQADWHGLLSMAQIDSTGMFPIVTKSADPNVSVTATNINDLVAVAASLMITKRAIHDAGDVAIDAIKNATTHAQITEIISDFQTTLGL